MDSSLILYPRAYNQRGGEHLHSVVGLTRDGREVNVKLRLEETHLGKPNAPSIAEFAREDRKARQACIAHPENGPDRREGVLLFTRVVEDTTNRGPLPVYIARWAVVLAEDADSPEPLIGYGRLAIERETPERRRLLRELEDARQAGSDTSVIEAALADGTKFQYPAIVYHPEELTQHDHEDRSGILKAISQAVDTHTRMGVAGGVLLRARTRDDRLANHLAPEVFSKYVVTARRYQTGDEVAADIEHRQLGQICALGPVVDVLPLSRIHSGPRGNQYYGAPDKLKQSERLYEREEGEPAICRVAIRLTIFDDTQNTLLSRIYAMSGPLGAPAQLDRHGVHLAFANPSDALHSESLLPVVRSVPFGELGRRFCVQFLAAPPSDVAAPVQDIFCPVTPRQPVPAAFESPAVFLEKTLAPSVQEQADESGVDETVESTPVEVATEVAPGPVYLDDLEGLEGLEDDDEPDFQLDADLERAWSDGNPDETPLVDETDTAVVEGIAAAPVATVVEIGVKPSVETEPLVADEEPKPRGGVAAFLKRRRAE